MVMIYLLMHVYGVRDDNHSIDNPDVRSKGIISGLIVEYVGSAQNNEEVIAEVLNGSMLLV